MLSEHRDFLAGRGAGDDKSGIASDLKLMVSNFIQDILSMAKQKKTVMK